MHILLTGGTGFVGRRLCKRLTEVGHTLSVYSRDPKKVTGCCGPETAAVSSLAADAMGKPVDAIINLAGEPIADKRWSSHQKQAIMNSRLTITRQVVDLIRQQDPPPKTLINASAIGFYGDQGNHQVTEDTTAVDGFTHQVCQQWESTALAVAGGETRVCIVRIGLVLGREGGMLSKMTPAFKAGLGGHIGSGKQWMSWVHIDDLTAVFAFLLNQTELSGIFNGTAPEPVTNQDFSRTLGKVLHRPARLPVPALALKVMLGEMSQLLLTGQRVLPKRLQEENFQFLHPTLNGALEAIYH